MEKMDKTVNIKRKVSFLFLCFLLAANSVLWLTIYFLKIKSLPLADKNAELKSDENLLTSTDLSNSCKVENIKNSDDDDVLFIGCNGFF